MNRVHMREMRGTSLSITALDVAFVGSSSSQSAQIGQIGRNHAMAISVLPTKKDARTCTLA